MSNDVFQGADTSTYEKDLNQGLSLSGEGREYYLQNRLRIMKGILETRFSFTPRRILDFGCAAGETALAMAQVWPEADVTGVDTSESLIAAARDGNASGRCRFELTGNLPGDCRFDFVYCNGVFHHIDPGERPGVLEWLSRHLSPGGYFVLWENNWWNPGTRMVMKRVPFDRDAVPLTPRYAVRMLRKAGFDVLDYRFAFVFPKCLSALRPLEHVLQKLPLGAQYQLISSPPSGRMP